MNKRFETIIATAVLGGVLSLAGCDGSSSKTSSPAAPETDAPTLTFAQTINATTIELFFSEEVTVANATQAAKLFAVRKNALNYDLNYVENCSPFATAYFSAYHCTMQSYTVFYSFVEGAEVANVTSAATVKSNQAKLRLKLNAAITPDTDSGGTGYLRLAYTSGSNGVEDLNGNPLASISIDANSRGNIADDTGAPVMIQATTVDSTTVQLTFNEPIKTTNAANIANWFFVTDNHLFPISLIYSTFTALSLGGSAWFYASTLAFSPIAVVTSGLSVSASGKKITLRLSASIPTTAAYNGYLQLIYTGQGSAAEITDADGNALANFEPGWNHRGNLKYGL